MPRVLLALALAGLGLLAGATALAQRPPRDGPPARAPHGDPKGWQFALPATGDRARGRAAFQKFECFACHEVRGERFPTPTKKDALGPELASMASHHSPAFLAESIVNPGAWIDRGMDYTGPDGSSKMPSFADSMTVQELIDLVAYLRGLKPPASRHH